MARQPASNKATDTFVLPKKQVVGATTNDPSFGKTAGTNIPDNSTYYWNQSIANVRSEPDVFRALRALARISGDVAAAISSFIALAQTNLNFQVYNAQHQIDDAGTLLLRSIVMSLDTTLDYTLNFEHRLSMDTLVETLIREALITGAVAGELVLDDNRLPYQIKPVSAQTLKWRISKQKTGKNTFKISPYQMAMGQEVDLDIPTFFYVPINVDPSVTYTKPFLEAALNVAVQYSEVMEDIRRVVRQSGHSRLVCTILTEQLMKAAPMDVKADPDKLTEWTEEVRAGLQSDLEELSPEDALVLFDTVQAEYLNSDIGSRADYTPLTDIIDGQQSTSLLTPPAILGKRNGANQNTASSETLIFLKTAARLHKPLQVFFSRVMTLAVRLYGFQGYVKARFGAIDLRPEHEIEAFKAMKQARILELLSLGFITDQEAAEELGTGMRAPGAPALSGTFFYAGSSNPAPAPDAVANSNNDPTRRALSGNAPKKTGDQSSPGR